jgi:hypothetical protein
VKYILKVVGDRDSTVILTRPSSVIAREWAEEHMRRQYAGIACLVLLEEADSGKVWYQYRNIRDVQPYWFLDTHGTTADLKQLKRCVARKLAGYIPQTMGGLVPYIIEALQLKYKRGKDNV